MTASSYPRGLPFVDRVMEALVVIGLIVAVLVISASIFGARLASAHGDLACAISPDPVTCIFVKEAMR
jgi:hypothetical protein